MSITLYTDRTWRLEQSLVLKGRCTGQFPPSKLAVGVELLAYIQEVYGSILSLDMYYIDWDLSEFF
jgi:hypothetical protein